jgi:hypothetical protein
MTHHANGQAGDAPSVEWLPLWQLDDPAVPPLPSPEQVLARERQRQAECERAEQVKLVREVLTEHLGELVREEALRYLAGQLPEAVGLLVEEAMNQQRGRR